MSDPEKKPEDQPPMLRKGTISNFAAKIATRIAFSPLRIRPGGKNYHVACGLIEGGILGYSIWYPNFDADEPHLVNRRMEGVGFYGYDHNRPKVFPDAYKNGKTSQHSKGRLVTFMLNSVIDNPPDQLTPLGLFDITDWDNLFTFDRPTIGDLLEDGFVRSVTNAEAYDNLGLLDQFGDELAQRSIADDRVFQVTPKGNTLIRLSDDSGEKTPKQSPSPQMRWLPGLAPSPAG